MVSSQRNDDLGRRLRRLRRQRDAAMADARLFRDRAPAIARAFVADARLFSRAIIILSAKAA